MASSGRHTRDYGSAGERGSAATQLVVLENGPQAPKRPAVLTAQPTAGAELLEQPIGNERRLGLARQLDPGGVAGSLQEAVFRADLDPVVLAGPALLDQAVGRIELDDGGVGPGETVQRHVDGVARARPAAVGLLAREPEVLQEVVGELAVVGDVREVLEDLLAGPRDGRGDGEGVHGAPQSTRRASPSARCGPPAWRARDGPRRARPGRPARQSPHTA